MDFLFRRKKSDAAPHILCQETNNNRTSALYFINRQTNCLWFQKFLFCLQYDKFSEGSGLLAKEGLMRGGGLTCPHEK